MPLIRVSRGTVILDLTRTDLELTADGLVDVYSFAQGYMAFTSERPLAAVRPSPSGLRFRVAPHDRQTVTATLAAILARPGTTRPREPEPA